VSLLDARGAPNLGPPGEWHDRYAAPVPAAERSELPAVTPRSVLAAAFGILRRQFRLIASAALVVFAISAGVDVLGEVLADHATNPGLLAVVLMVTSLAVFGTEFFAGLLDRIVGEEERGHPRQSLGRVLRTLPYGRLIVADVLLTLGSAALLLLLFVPGLIFFTWFSLVGPVIVMEDKQVFDAFGRSRRLVRGKFSLVFLLVTLPVLVEEELVHGIVGAFDSVNPLLVFVVNVVAGAAVGSIVAVIEVTLANRLAVRKPESRRWQESNPPDGVRPSHSF
jgi:hypothetical protein